MKRLYGHETGLDVDDPDGYAYGVSTYHFNMHIAGLVAKRLTRALATYRTLDSAEPVAKYARSCTTG